MFSSIAKFFIQNSKLTVVLIIVILISWVWSYFILPKQYNPTIVVPAFNVFVNSSWLSSTDISKYIISPLENKIMEIEWIDEVYWIAWDNYAWVMVKFKVWENSEDAKIRLNQKINENLNLKPYWVSNPVVTTINPEELPQITYAIYYDNLNASNGEELSIQDQEIYLLQVANIIKDKLKIIKNVTTLNIVWWIRKNIIINLDLEKIEAKNTDIMQVYSVLKKNNLYLPNWNFNLPNWERVFVETTWTLDDVESLKKLVISNISWSTLYLSDVAEISYWEKRLSKYSLFSTKEAKNKNAVFLWIWKQVWTNWVFVTNEIKSQMDEIIKELPRDIWIEIIQDEWAEAQEATGHLIKDLIESIIIVVVILVLFLWWKNALNTATSIPLILSLVFLYAYIVWYNINRISLFALILVIWMLVDDSIVVVENIHRHLEERIHTWKTKLEAILESVQEVGSGVILSTITKILSFAWMFAVTWMMWEYMWPIPKFAIVALLFSILVAFSINPWVSYMTTKNIDSNEPHHVKKESKFDVRKVYLKFMNLFIRDDKKAKRNRKIFKTTFWISLILVMILPIYFWVFKARMLPKSNKNQVYLWVDSVRWTNVEKMLEIEKDIENFFLNNYDLPKELDIVESVSSTIWTPFMWDFANLFRWWSNRLEEYQISTRINLISKDEHKDRIKSENYTFNIRPLLTKYLLEKYPDVKLRLLEDPPGPPVRATFMLKVKWWDNDKNLDEFTNYVFGEVKKLELNEKLADLNTSISTTYRKVNIELDHESIARSGLDIEQVANTIAIAKNVTNISIIKNSPSLEETNILLWVKNEQSESLNMLESIKFTNSSGLKIPLSSIAKINYEFVSPEINTDTREKTNFIYSEMWDNSVVYPIVKLISIFKSDEFLNWKYEVIESWFYGIKYRSLVDYKIYKLEWDWEWKLTMDTFRDLWTAMILALLAIYFLIVWQFRSFAVAWIVMLPFLLWFFWIFPGFSLLYVFKNEYFNATWMIWVISLAWIVVWNAILLIDYIDILKKKWWTIEKAIINAGYIRFMPIMLTSISAIFWAIKITSDPVWSWLARSIVWWLSSSAILTLIAIPIFYYDSQKNEWEKCAWKTENLC